MGLHAGLASWVLGRWHHSGLRPGLGSSLLGLASSSGPFDYTHSLWLVHREGVCSCDSCVFPGAWSEGFQLVLRPDSRSGDELGLSEFKAPLHLPLIWPLPPSADWSPAAVFPRLPPHSVEPTLSCAHGSPNSSGLRTLAPTPSALCPHVCHCSHRARLEGREYPCHL